MMVCRRYTPFKYGHSGYLAVGFFGGKPNSRSFEILRIGINLPLTQDASGKWKLHFTHSDVLIVILVATKFRIPGGGGILPKGGFNSW